jgi:ATP-dependent Clp protease ATP-binding subunit ClpC
MRSEADMHLERAAHLQATGAFAEAVTAYEAALQTEPELLPAATGLAKVRELRGQWSHAAEAWTRVLEIDPEHAEAATSRAECLRQAGCYHLALAAYDTALVLDGEQLYALAGKAEALRMLGRPDEALHWFDRALMVHPEHGFALRGKAAGLNALARYEESVKVWEQASGLDPTSTFAAQGLKEARLGVQRASEGHLNPTAPAPPPLTGEALASEIERDWGRALAQDERHGEAAAAFERSLAKVPNRPDVVRELARVYDQAGRHDDALVAWQRLAALQPDRSEPHAWQGDSLRQLGRAEEALLAYERALILDEHHVQALTGKADVLRGRKLWDEALVWYDRALARKPTLGAALRGKAAALEALERWEEARPVWRQSLALEPTSELGRQGLARAEAALRGAGESLPVDEPTLDVDPQARARARDAWELGRSLVNQGRYAEAARALRQATEEDPTFTAAWLLLGLAQAEERQFRPAIHAFDEVIAREPEHLEALVNRADSMRRNNEYATAIHEYEAILARWPEEVRALAGRAESLRMLGRFEEAAAAFDRTLALRPRQYLALCGKAAALNALRRYDEAYPVWVLALRENPNASFVKRGIAQCRSGMGERAEARTRPPAEPRALPVAAPPTQLQLPRRTDRHRAVEEVERGRLLYKEKDYVAAVAAFETALRLDPTWPDAALRLGMAHEDDKQYRKAIDAYERCLRIDPTHCQAATNIGEALRKSERYDDAVRAYDRALGMKPDYLYALAGRAECMRMLKDYQGSLWWFDRALRVGPSHAFAIQGKAAALNALQQWAEALPLWDRALEIEPQSSFAREGKRLCEQHLEPGEVRAEPESTTPVLDEQGRDLSALARQGALTPVVGRDTEIRSVIKTLVRRLKANPLLLGDPGVGKTAVVEGVAMALARPDAPERLRKLRLVELSVGSLLAGTKYRGTFEERLKEVIREARENRHVVLFIDEIHTLVGAGRTEGGSLDAANILKPALARGEITVIGATTVSEYREHFESDSALDRRFQPIHIEEPSPEDTVNLLVRLRPLYEAHHSVQVDDQALSACVRLAVRFVPERRLPDKALDLLDESCADASLSLDAAGVAPRVDARRVAQVVAERIRVPVDQLTEGERDRLSRMEEVLGERVIGQSAAVSELAAAVRLARSGLRAPRRPRGVFLFAGTSGVGKTELARALADYLFPEGNALVKLDMSEYAERFTGTRLLGAPPGYQGHGEEGQLTGPLRRRPYAVVLLDEFEKAHEDVQAMFLSLFDEGTVTDATGRVVHAREAFFVLTTNLGTERGGRGRLGFGADERSARRAMVLDRAKDRLRPELLNRVDGLVVFEDLATDDLAQIAKLHLQRLADRAAETGARFTFAPEVVRWVLRPEAGLGARPTLRAIDERVAEPLARLVLGRGDRDVGVHVRVVDGALVFDELVASSASNSPGLTETPVAVEGRQD